MGAPPLLSVCIPSYNGGTQLPALIASLLRAQTSDLEVVVSDDCSSDDSWAFLESAAQSDGRLRVQRNAANLGMDRNFAHSASLARGRYIWFSGQDDLIKPEGIERVLAYLREHPDTDFILMSHAKRVKSAHGEHIVEPDAQDEHVSGAGLDSYVAHTRHHLPTFLPTYLIRAERWHGIDVSRYYGTCYCQVGVFLEAARDMRWCHFAGNHVVGLLPADGWQAHHLSFARIALGHFAMLARAREHAPWVTTGMLHAFCRLQKRRLVYSVLLMRRHRLDMDPQLVREALQTIQAFPDMRRPVQLALHLPRALNAFVLTLVDLRRALRARLARSASA